MSRPFARLLLAGGTVVTLIAAFGGIAGAHVTISSLGDATAGGFAKLAFSVPNERDDSATVKLEVQLPTDHPLAFVSVAPKPGWDVATTTRTLTTPVQVEGSSVDTVVDTITWTAQEGTAISAGQFDQFWVSAGALPTDVDQLEFPSLQTYADGEVVRWIDPPTDGGAEPEHPAPTLQLVATDAAAGAPVAAGATDDDGTSAISVVALVVGALGLLAGIAALATSRKRA